MDQWKRDILPGLDIERTFGTADPSRFLDIVYVNRTTGTRAEGDAHLGAAPRDGKPHLRGHAPGLGMKLVRQSFSRE